MSENWSDVISIRDFTRGEVDEVLEQAFRMEQEDCSHRLDGRVLALVFFEPSTRTRLSFASAMMKLGGNVLEFGDPDHTSLSKGETLSDTIRIVSGYCDIMAIRHPWEGAARLASEVSSVPVINAGDGSNQHPTQTFLDLFTMRKLHKGLDGLTVGYLGDLKYSRTVHSLAVAMCNYECRQHFIAPETLQAPDHLLAELDECGAPYGEHADPGEVLPDLDILYCTRIQEERFPESMEYEKVKGIYRTDLQLLENAGVKDTFRVMHPLPRVDELSTDVDDSRYAAYFEQAKNGLPVRQALLSALLGEL
jgi:aspartate carbamoyltransferase catalytic subunit